MVYVYSALTMSMGMLCHCNTYVYFVQGVHSVLEFACVGGNPDIVRLILDRIQFQEEHADEV